MIILRKEYFIFLLMIFLFFGCHNIHVGRIYVHKKDRRVFLESCMGDSLIIATKDRIVKRKYRLIKTRNDALKIAEPILNDKYGMLKIQDEKPFDVFYINGFWVVKGTVKKGYKGGTAIAILDSENGLVERVFHTK